MSGFRELRARITTGDVIRALDLWPRGDGFGCPRCGAEIELGEDTPFGVSLRCHSPRCRLRDWRWPEYVLAELRGLCFEEAQRRLLDAVHKHDERRRREGGTRHATAVRRFNVA